jgi:DNA-binding HxlR family transcriptional regulator
LQHASNIAPSAKRQQDISEGRNPPEGEDLTALTAACEILGDRWSLPLVAALLAGPLRYGELQDRLPAIAPNILSARLRKLEDAGLIVSLRYSARPPRFEYLLSPDGAALADAVRALGAWAGRRGGGAHAPLHAACGTELEVRWWCPTCEVSTAPGEDAPILA